MTASTRAKATPAPPIEVDHILITQQIHGGFWTWTLFGDQKTKILAQSPHMAPNLVELFRQLCAIFDLVATPEHYAARASRRTLVAVQAANGRWLDITYGGE